MIIQNLIGEVSEGTQIETEQPAGGAISDWELKIIKDPLFDTFLKFGPGRTGIGPKTVSDFLSLSPKDKKFYAEVFKNWKKVVKQKGLADKLKKIREKTK